MLRVDQELRAGVLRHLSRWIDDAATREDLGQEVLLRLHAQGPEGPDAVVHWVRHVTRNVAIDHLRGRRLRGELPELATEELVLDEGTRRVASWLPLLLEAVPEPYRTAVRRVDLEGISQQQLAVELGLSASGARSRVQRGRRLLKQELLGCCPVRFDGGQVVDTGECGGC